MVSDKEDGTVPEFMLKQCPSACGICKNEKNLAAAVRRRLTNQPMEMHPLLHCKLAHSSDLAVPGACGIAWGLP